MNARLLALLLSLLALSLVPPADDGTVAELLQEVLDRRDACDVRSIYQKLAKQGDEPAFEAMVAGFEVLLEDENRNHALRALGAFASHPDDELKGRVVQYLDEGLKQEGQNPQAVSRATSLAAFGALAEEELYEHMEGNYFRVTRGALLKGVLDRVVEAGDGRGLERILLHFSVITTGKQEDLRRALEGLYKPSHLRRTVKILDRPGILEVDSKRILQAFAEIPGKDVDKLFGQLVVASNVDVRRTALEGIVLREGVLVSKLHRDRFKKERDPEARGSALAGLLANPKTREKAAKDLLKAAGSKSDHDREMAAVALRTSGVGDLQVLLPLLADGVLQVRIHALEAASRRREKAALPALIERLDGETEKKLVDVHKVLKELTGKDFGTRSHRWRTWWERDGAAFELPDRYAARREATNRDLKRQRRERGSRYGINPKGAGIYFLLDVSDSMKRYYDMVWNEKGRPERLLSIDVLGEEMTGILERMRDGQRFNILRFGTSLESLAPELIPLDGEARRLATEFVQRKDTLGATAVHDALQLAFEDRGTDTIYLISDGEPKGGQIDDPQELLRQVKKWNRRGKVTIHCVSLHLIPSQFLESLAEQHGGSYTHVPPPR